MAYTGADIEIGFDDDVDLEIVKAFAVRLRELRGRKHVTQARLADMIGKTGSVIGKFERGESIPKFSTVCKIAHVLNVPLSYFSCFDDYDKHATDEDQTLVLLKQCISDLDSKDKNKLVAIAHILAADNDDHGFLKNLP